MITPHRISRGFHLRYLCAASLALPVVFFYANLFPATASAQSRLPPCPPDHSTVWTNCFGKYTYSDSDPPGAKYVGEFRNDKRNGKGTYIQPDGWKYVGEFRNNLRNGQGTYFYPDGSKYVGEFRNDKSNGARTIFPMAPSEPLALGRTTNWYKVEGSSTPSSNTNASSSSEVRLIKGKPEPSWFLC